MDNSAICRKEMDISRVVVSIVIHSEPEKQQFSGFCCALAKNSYLHAA